ncbi:hypothetical protein B0I00_1908 [Novosphingobium kunmingense]|uniref:Uncharacterized protein n=1 Tax=Novosphingobium kunmingense TaxID=1211806 RepID=A0A2N0HLA2_9SPHN|nr:hypothetical protein [Novosphingobium kunmingense]PKB19668.1 hypothetical protein B0I00_1908 [Novosphingobium kunmingense]
MDSAPGWLAWLNSGAAVTAGAAIAWLFNAWIEARKTRDDRTSASEQTQLRVGEHGTELMKEVLRVVRADLDAAKLEVAQLRGEMAAFQDIERRLMHFEEALFHIDHLIRAEETGDREAAEHAAELFLTKMRALRQLRGDEANREQAARAAGRLFEDKEG